MTDQPINHRAEAERWLNAAKTGPGSSEPTHMALIGIGHALLAAFPDDDAGHEGLPPPNVIHLDGDVSEADLARIKAALRPLGNTPDPIKKPA